MLSDFQNCLSNENFGDEAAPPKPALKTVEPKPTGNNLMKALDNFMEKKVEQSNIKPQQSSNSIVQVKKEKVNIVKEVKSLMVEKKSSKSIDKFDVESFLKTLNPDIAYKQKQDVISIRFERIFNMLIFFFLG